MADKQVSELNTLDETTISTADSLLVYDTTATEVKSITKEDFDQSIGEVLDNTFTVTDNADTTKKMRFQVSGVTTGTARTLTVPDASTTIVGTDAPQTLTNKTIDPASNTIDGDKLDITFTPTYYTPTTTGVSQADDVDDLSAHLKGIDNALNTTNTREIFFPSTGTTTVGDFRVQDLSTGNAGRFVFKAPDDFVSLSELVLVMIPDTTEAISVTVQSDYGASGEAYTTNDGTTGALTPSVTANQITEVDISACVTSLAAGDYVGITATSGTSTLRYIGINFKYTTS